MAGNQTLEGEKNVFVVLLRFTRNKHKAAEYMDAHNAWIKRGFEDGVFVLIGSLEPGLGGAVLAASDSPEELVQRVNEDPFVVEQIVDVEILQISPKRVSESLGFLLGRAPQKQVAQKEQR